MTVRNHTYNKNIYCIGHLPLCVLEIQNWWREFRITRKIFRGTKQRFRFIVCVFCFRDARCVNTRTTAHRQSIVNLPFYQKFQKAPLDRQMIPQRDDGLSLLTKGKTTGCNNVKKKSRNRRLSPGASTDVPLPIEIVVDHIAPFLDRRTYNSCLLLCRKARRILQASWWKNQYPPWPRKLVSRDSCCRVRCLEFSNDNLLLACGCSDGKVRSWDVRLGEFPLPPSHQSHWPDEAVIALAYSNCNTNRMLASSSTDGTIRIWQLAPSSTAMKHNARLEAPKCTLCVPSNHAVSIHFSPDDSYLVSGHLAERNEQNLLLSSTIEVRDVRTGTLLRRLESGGIPLGFLPPSTSFPISGRHHKVQTAPSQEHRLLATCGPNTCLKLWSWNYKNFKDNNQTENVVNGGRCIQQWFLDRFNTVSSVPTTTNQNKASPSHEPTNRSCEMFVATINEPSKDSFSVWNTGSPHERKIFQNTSPYEIQFSPDGTKIASVDDFNTVKVWRISDGVLLKTFSGGSEYNGIPKSYNDSIRFGGEENDLDESSVSYTDLDLGIGEDALFPIHELVFSKDSSTVAVISRSYNEVHLFSI